MKLSQIYEARNRMRKTADALSGLVDFLQQHGSQQEQHTIDVFLQKPTPQAWKESQWLIDSALRIGAGMERNDELDDNLENWAVLKRLTPQMVAAAVYDMTQASIVDTPRQTLSMTEPSRNRLKRALGPLGYVSTMAGISELPKAQAKKFLKTTARHSNAFISAARHDMPGTKIVRQF